MKLDILDAQSGQFTSTGQIWLLLPCMFWRNEDFAVIIHPDPAVFRVLIGDDLLHASEV